MPTPQEIEAYLRQMGTGATSAGQNAIAQGVDQPIQQKLHALQQMGNNPPPPQAAPPVPNPGVPYVLPNDPNMSPQDQKSRMNAMIAAPLSGGTELTLDGAQAQRQKMLNMYNAASAEKANEVPDTSGFSDVNQHPVARQFPQLKKKIASGTPITTKDIRSATSPTEALTPEQEEEMDKTRGQTEKAGTAEGNYR